MRNDISAKASNDIANAVNSFNFDDKAFCETMLREHKTLQQSFTRLCFEWIKACGQNKNVDARNEASVKACKQLSEIIENENINLPLI